MQAYILVYQSTIQSLKDNEGKKNERVMITPFRETQGGEESSCHGRVFRLKMVKIRLSFIALSSCPLLCLFIREDFSEAKEGYRTKTPKEIDRAVQRRQRQWQRESDLQN